MPSDDNLIESLADAEARIRRSGWRVYLCTMFILGWGGIILVTGVLDFIGYRLGGLAWRATGLLGLLRMVMLPLWVFSFVIWMGLVWEWLSSIRRYLRTRRFWKEEHASTPVSGILVGSLTRGDRGFIRSEATLAALLHRERQLFRRTAWLMGLALFNFLGVAGIMLWAHQIASGSKSGIGPAGRELLMTLSLFTLPMALLGVIFTLSGCHYLLVWFGAVRKRQQSAHNPPRV